METAAERSQMNQMVRIASPSPVFGRINSQRLLPELTTVCQIKRFGSNEATEAFLKKQKQIV